MDLITRILNLTEQELRAVLLQLAADRPAEVTAVLDRYAPAADAA